MSHRESKHGDEVLKFIEKICQQAEGSSDSFINNDASVCDDAMRSCQLDMVLNNVEQFICNELSFSFYDTFVELFSSAEKSSLTE